MATTGLLQLLHSGFLGDVLELEGVLAEYGGNLKLLSDRGDISLKPLGWPTLHVLFEYSN